MTDFSAPFSLDVVFPSKVRPQGGFSAGGVITFASLTRLRRLKVRRIALSTPGCSRLKRSPHFSVNKAVSVPHDQDTN